MPFEKITINDENELEDIVIKELDVIEEGLTFIDKILTDTGKIILCHDTDGRLVILDSRTLQDDKALFNGLRCLDYYDSVMSVLKADEEKSKVRYDNSPRLILIAPSFSEDVLRVVKRIESIQISLFEWEYLKLGDQKGLYLKPVSPIISEERRLWSRLRQKLLDFRKKETPLQNQGE